MSFPVRDAFVRLHRWVGLSLAGFLVVAGLTGSVIVFNHELDEWLNPELYRAATGGSPHSPLDIAEAVDAQEAGRRVSYVPLTVEPGHALVLGLSEQGASDGQPAYYERFIDPATGATLGEREWGACCFSRKQLVPFLYSIHYSLHLPQVWGMRIMGAIAILWLIDSFVGFYLTLPARRRRNPAAARALARSDVANPAPSRSFWQRWAPAWRVKTDASFHRFNFDLHRATGLWLYPLLIALALSGIYLALGAEVFRPAMNLIADVSPDPYVKAATAAKPVPRGEGLSYRQIVAIAEEEARRRGWEAPFDAFYAHDFGVYGVGFGDHHRPGLGVPYLYFSAADGRILAESIPGQGTRGDVFMQAMFPLHNGNIAGLPGRILIAISGVLVAVLSVTGVVIWEKKRRGRRALAARERARSDTAPHRTAAAPGVLPDLPRAARDAEA